MGGETGTPPSPSPAPRLSGPFVRFPGPAGSSGSPFFGSRSRRMTALLGVPLVMLTGASIAGNLLAPGLLTAHPLLLVALAPRMVYLAAAAGDVPFVAFVAVAVLRLCAADPSHFLLGRLHGGRAAAAVARRRGPRRTDPGRLDPGRRRRPGRPDPGRLDPGRPAPGRPAPGRPTSGRLWARLWDRLGLVLVAISPTGKVLLLAGASRLPHRRVAAAAVVGTVAQVVMLYGAGRAVAEPGQAVAGTMAAFAPVAALVTVAVLLTTAVASRLARRSDSPRIRSAGLATGFGRDEFQAQAVDLLEQLPLAAGTPKLHLQVAGAGYIHSHP